MSQPTPPQPLSWRIQPVTPANLDAIVRFVRHARREMFPTLCAQLDADVAHLVQSGHFLCATNAAADSQHSDDEEAGEEAAAEAAAAAAAAAETGEKKDNIIATIGYVPYNHRFPHLPYNNDSRYTVEVVRLYVIPAYRRCGLASALVSELKQCAIKDRVERLYLHTHPFLPGAIAFWERQGFRVRAREDDDEVWRTVHMDVMLVGGHEDEGYDDDEEETKAP